MDILASVESRRVKKPLTATDFHYDLWVVVLLLFYGNVSRPFDV